MAQEVFKRYEKKYILTERQYGVLIGQAGSDLVMDQYGMHTICNLYLDTPDYEWIRTSLEKPVYKEKMRLRCYGAEAGDDSRVFLELKKKFESVVYKRRAELSLKEAEDYLCFGVKPDGQGQIFRELDYTKRRCGVKPVVYLSYRRTAWTYGPDPDVRVTFDRDIVGRTDEVSLRTRAWGKRILGEGLVLMEVKVPGAFPLKLSRMLAENAIYPVTFSKYGVFYSDYVCRKKIPRPAAEIGRSCVREGGIICA